MLTLSVRHHASADDAIVEQELVRALRANDPPNDARPLSVMVHDAGGILVGMTAYGWLFVKSLWVDPSHRGAGIGSRLMNAAEAAAADAGCHGAWLDTSSRRAATFYERLGYASFGQLDNRLGEVAPGHLRQFMRKRFADHSA